MQIVTEEDTPAGTLKSMLAEADNLECVIIIAITNDGYQKLRCSRTSTINKSFLIAFAQSWLMKWFQTENE